MREINIFEFRGKKTAATTSFVSALSLLCEIRRRRWKKYPSNNNDNECWCNRCLFLFVVVIAFLSLHFQQNSNNKTSNEQCEKKHFVRHFYFEWHRHNHTLSMLNSTKYMKITFGTIQHPLKYNNNNNELMIFAKVRKQ